MMLRRLISEPALDRARRSTREIFVAMALTLAAVVFVIAALRDNGPETASIEQQDVPAESSQN